MKTQLDDPKIFSQYDTLSVYDSLVSIGEQFESAWHDSQFVSLNFEPEKIINIVFAGMGGSNLSAHVVQSLSPLLLKTPFEIISNYRLPQYTSKDTLVILVSYSGNTEEILSCAQDSAKRQSKTVVVTTGGKLKDIALAEHWPLILLDEKLNRSHVPRYGIGLLLGAILGLTVRLNPESFRFVDPKEIVRILERTLDTLKADRPADDNPAKSFALKNKGQAVIIFSANHLSGVGKIFTNFLNETSKTFSAFYTIPDLNHHLMEGLVFPTTLKDSVRFVFINSTLYPEIIQKRFQLTKDILIKQNYQLTVIKPESSDIVAQTFESLAFLVMISYYLSIVNKQDPGTNPWVDFFKKQLT
ncbi:MAG TPA: SIS domain-containing protein [Spirochaetia bacterium]|nr:SIS domain-containing protein [Spirochaetia bacterium]